MPVRTGLPQHVVDEIVKSIPIEYRTVGEINATIDSRLNQLIPRARRLGVTTLTLVELYSKQHLTLREIATKVGMSAQAICKRLRRAGVKATDGTWVTRDCEFCGKSIQVRRGVARRSIASYCNTECYYASRENLNYKPWRQGQRLARALVAQYFKLEPEHVVDHRDGDERNNNITNLRVYASQSDHMKMHHGKSVVVPLWDGSES
jgi:hypothetical protein